MVTRRRSVPARQRVARGRSAYSGGTRRLSADVARSVEAAGLWGTGLIAAGCSALILAPHLRQKAKSGGQSNWHLGQCMEQCLHHRDMLTLAFIA